MTRQRVRTLILAILMALVFVAPEFTLALAEAEAPAPTEAAAAEGAAESATQAPQPSAGGERPAKQYKVKFVDSVTGKAIGEVQRVNAGEAAVLPDAPDHSDLGFQFAGWDRDASAIRKNLTVTAQYASLHQVALGEFEAAKAAPGGKLRLALPVVFKSALNGGEAASNRLAGGGAAAYDAKREIQEYDQGALVSMGIDWIRIDLDLSGTPLKAVKSDRSSYVLRPVKDSKKRYGIPNGQPVNRGFATFDAVKARAGAKGGTYALKGAIVWRLKGTALDNRAPFEIKLKVGGASEQAAPDAAAAQGGAAPNETQAPDESEILVANQGPKATPEVQILGSEPTEAPEPTATPEATEAPEVTEAPEATEAPEVTAAPEATGTAEATAAPEITEAPESSATPESAAAGEPAAGRAALSALDAALSAGAFEPAETSDPDAAAAPDGTAEPDATAAPEASLAPEESAIPDASLMPEAAVRAFTAKDADLEAGDEGEDETGDEDGTADGESYTATFIDHDGRAIAVTTVQAGYTPSAPGDYVAGSKPVKKVGGAWSVFSGWDAPLDAMTQNTYFKAQYDALPYEVVTTYVDSFDGATYTDSIEAEAAVADHTNMGYKFTSWKEEATQGAGVIKVTATAQYELISILTVCPRAFATGKPKGSMVIALPVSYAINSSLAFSDALAATGKRAEKYTGKESASDFDQAQLSALGVQDVRIALDAFGSDAPVTAASLSPAYVVQGGENKGYAVFDGITVKSSATNGYYTLTGTLYWRMQGQAKESSVTFTTQVRVTGATTSSGGSSYGGGGTSGTGKEKPQARLMVEAITTDPLGPKAGQNFEVVLSLKNTSPDYFVQNVGVTYTSDDDALMPAAGSNTVYIAKIGKSESYELRLPVKASPELANENVKIDLAMDYVDNKLTSLTASQSVMVKVQQVQRIQLDELQLPATQPTAGDSVQLSLGIFNLGRTVLYNVKAKVVSDNPNLAPGQSFFGGNMDPGTSKTAEIDVTPLEAGEYAGNVVVTYENAMGEEATETRPFTLHAGALEDLDYSDMQTDFDVETPAPEAPSAVQIMQYLPAWLYAAVGLLLLMIILAIAMSARRRRRRMFEDDEMD